MICSEKQPTKSVDLTQEDKDDTIVEAEKNVSDVRLLLAVWTTTSRITTSRSTLNWSAG